MNLVLIPKCETAETVKAVEKKIREIREQFEVKNEVYKIQATNKNSDSESDSDRDNETIEERHLFEKFLAFRN